MRRESLLITLFISAVVAVGCDSNRPVALEDSGATLEGKVTYGNEQLQFALIIVTNGQSSATGKITPEGKYVVKNVPLGEVKIGVNTDAATGDFQAASMSGGAYKGPEGKGKGKVELKLITVPNKYFDPNTSGITTTITKRTNTFNIVVPK